MLVIDDATSVPIPRDLFSSYPPLTLFYRVFFHLYYHCSFFFFFFYYYFFFCFSLFFFFFFIRYFLRSFSQPVRCPAAYLGRLADVHRPTTFPWMARGQVFLRGIVLPLRTFAKGSRAFPERGAVPSRLRLLKRGILVRSRGDPCVAMVRSRLAVAATTADAHGALFIRPRGSRSRVYTSGHKCHPNEPRATRRKMCTQPRCS